jgi:hypothetical protein
LNVAVKALAVSGLILSSLLFCYLAYQETRFGPRASAMPSVKTPEYVHERYQRSYFSAQDAHLLRRLHHEEAIVFIAMIACWAAVLYPKSKRQSRS